MGAVAGAEEKNGGPIVGQVFGGNTGRAGCRRGHVVCDWIHGDIEGVATDDLVEMGRGSHAGVDERVKAVDDELCA